MLLHMVSDAELTIDGLKNPGMLRKIYSVLNLDGLSEKTLIGNESSGSVKGERIRDEHSDCYSYLLKEGLAAWCYTDIYSSPFNL
jgi:hypothetical protein